MLEINESLIMENPEQAIETLNLLKGLGANLCLDNFGASYSSLTYLHRLPFDMIKIDRQLLGQDSKDRAGAVVFKSIVSMARELDKDVIASGVERDDEDAYVKAIGCDYAQGFYYGEPMTEKEVLALIQSMSKSVKRDEKRARKIEVIETTPMPEVEEFVEEAPSEPEYVNGRSNYAPREPAVFAVQEAPPPPPAPRPMERPTPFYAAQIDVPPDMSDFELVAGTLDTGLPPEMEEERAPEITKMPFVKRPSRA